MSWVGMIVCCEVVKKRKRSRHVFWGRFVCSLLNAVSPGESEDELSKAECGYKDGDYAEGTEKQDAESADGICSGCRVMFSMTKKESRRIKQQRKKAGEE